MTLDLADIDGKLTVQSVANGAAISNNGTANITLTGTPTAISTTLAAGVTYNSGSFSGNDTLTLTADDQGNTALGRPLTSSQSVTIAVGATPAVLLSEIEVDPPGTSLQQHGQRRHEAPHLKTGACKSRWPID